MPDTRDGVVTRAEVAESPPPEEPAVVPRTTTETKDVIKRIKNAAQVECKSELEDVAGRGGPRR